MSTDVLMNVSKTADGSVAYEFVVNALERSIPILNNDSITYNFNLNKVTIVVDIHPDAVVILLDHNGKKEVWEEKLPASRSFLDRVRQFLGR